MWQIMWHIICCMLLFFWRGNSKIVLKISKFKSLTDVWCKIFLMSDERGVIFLPLRWKVSITNFRFYCIFMSHLIFVKFFLFDIYGKFRFLNNVRNSFTFNISMTNLVYNFRIFGITIEKFRNLIIFVF